jgi:hypothetical protein
MIGGHNNLPSFDRYDTVSADDLKEAAGRLQACLPTGTITGAEALGHKKRGQPGQANLLRSFGAVGEPRTLKGTRPGGF